MQIVVCFICYNKSLCIHDYLNKCFCFVEETSIRAEKITQLKTGEKLRWSEVKGARNYICKIGGPDIFNSSLLGDEPSLEIPYSALNFKNEKNKQDPVEVVIEVLAVSDNGVIGKGGPFNISKLFCRIVQQVFHCIRQQTLDKCAELFNLTSQPCACDRSALLNALV